MNKSQLEDDVFYGDHAETITTNPAYQLALTRVKARIFEQWTNTGFFQSKERKDLWRMARVVEDFEKQMQILMNDRAIAKEDLKRLK